MKNNVAEEIIRLGAKWLAPGVSAASRVDFIRDLESLTHTAMNQLVERMNAYEPPTELEPVEH